MSRWFRTYGFAEVSPDLVIGAVPLDEDDISALEFIGVRRVLNLVEEDEYEPGTRALVELGYRYAGIEELRLPFVDFGHLTAGLIDDAVTKVSYWLDEGQCAYLHCRAGWQRSAAVAAAVIATRQGLEIDEAVRIVRERKPSANPLPHQLEDLRRWWQARQLSGT